MNPPNNIQNGFFTPVSPFFSKIRKLTIFSRNPHTPIIPQSVRLRMGRGRVIRAEKPAFRPVRPAHSNSSETKKIICPTHAAHVGHMIGELVQSFPALPDLPPRGRGTARRRWKEFVTITGLREIATMRCICICELYCCRLGNVESSSADDGTRSARPRGLGGDFDFSPLNPLGTP